MSQFLRKILYFVLIAITALGLPLQVMAATLSLVPTTQQLQRGCTYTTDVVVDTEGADTDGADSIIFYDPTKLSITADSIQTGNTYAGYPDKRVDATNGVIHLSGISMFGPAYNGKGSLGTITFTVKSDAPLGPTDMRFDFDPSNPGKTTDSNVVERNTIAEVLRTVTNTSFSIVGGNCGEPIPTPTPNPTNTPTPTPTATPIQKTATFSLVKPNGYQYVGTEFAVDVYAQTDSEAANLFTAHLNFNPAVAQVTRITTDRGQSIINPSTWADRSFSNTQGKIYLAGGVPNPGVKTQGAAYVATVYFQPKTAGSLNVQYIINESAIYSNATNQNILTSVTGTTISVLKPAVKNAVFSMTTLSNTPKVNDQFAVRVYAQSPDDAANLFAAFIDYDPTALEVVRTETEPISIVQMWASNTFNNTQGRVELVGGVGTPGYKSAAAGYISTVIFKAKKAGTTSINFNPSSVIYRDTDNANILKQSTGVAVNVQALGEGLKANYFNNKTLTGTPVLVRTDTTVNFDWKDLSPAAVMKKDGFSVRWTGSVEAPVDGTYTFYTYADDGVKLTINNKLVINQWTDGSAREFKTTVALKKGVKMPIKLEYFENTGQAVAKLSWSSNTVTKQIIPQASLFSY